jgi:hypothetical protein
MSTEVDFVMTPKMKEAFYTLIDERLFLKWSRFQQEYNSVMNTLKTTIDNLLKV